MEVEPQTWIDEYNDAVRAEQIAAETEPRAESIAYDKLNNSLNIQLKTRTKVDIPVTAIVELTGATPVQIEEVEIWGCGDTLHWESLDADISVPGLVMEAIGFAEKMMNWLNELEQEELE